MPLGLNGGMHGRTRVEAGRRRAEVAKRTVALTAAGAFATTLVLVRHEHPAAARSSSTRHVSQFGISPSSNDDGGYSLDGGSIAPSSGGTAPLSTATS
jgi:hypothetical protein